MAMRSRKNSAWCRVSHESNSGEFRARASTLTFRKRNLTQLGLSLETIESTLAEQNLVVDSGGVDLPTKRLRIEQTGSFVRRKTLETS